VTCWDTEQSLCAKGFTQLEDGWRGFLDKEEAYLRCAPSWRLGVLGVEVKHEQKSSDGRDLFRVFAGGAENQSARERKLRTQPEREDA